MRVRSFILAWLATGVAIASCTAAINWLIDPYLMFDMPRLRHFNERKPSVLTHEREMKAYLVKRAAPTTVLIGTSRVALGLDAKHPAWPERLRPVYNLGLPGGGPYTWLRYLQHALFDGGIKEVVIGLDFEYFLAPDGWYQDPAKEGTEFDHRLAVTRQGIPNQFWRRQRLIDVGQALLSLDGLRDSIITVRANLTADSADLDRSGNLSDAEFRRDVAQFGAFPLFENRNRQTLQRLAIELRLRYSDGQREVSPMAILRLILELCRKHDIAVILFVQPVHASLLEAYDLLQHWHDFEAWKRDLVALAGDFQRRRGLDLSLWDFSGYNRYSEETVPEPGDRKTRLQWFWDPAHHTRSLGDVIIRSLFAANAENFGVRLTADSLEQHLDRTRRHQKLYQAAHPETRARLAQLYQGISKR